MSNNSKPFISISDTSISCPDMHKSISNENNTDDNRAISSNSDASLQNQFDTIEEFNSDPFMQSMGSFYERIISNILSWLENHNDIFSDELEGLSDCFAVETTNAEKTSNTKDLSLQRFLLNTSDKTELLLGLEKWLNGKDFSPFSPPYIKINELKKVISIMKMNLIDINSQHNADDDHNLLNASCSKRIFTIENEADLKMHQSYFGENSFPNKKQKLSHVCEESNFQKHTLANLTNNNEPDLLQSPSSKSKNDSSVDETSEYNPLDDDSLLDTLYSVFDFMSEDEEKSLSCMELQNPLISATDIDIENEHSEPYLMQCIRLLQYFLADIKNGLLIKENYTSQLKLSLESYLKELDSLYSHDIAMEYINNKCRDLQSTGKGLVHSSDNILASIKENRAQCEWYSEMVQNMLNVE